MINLQTKMINLQRVDVKYLNIPLHIKIKYILENGQYIQSVNPLYLRMDIDTLFFEGKCSVYRDDHDTLCDEICNFLNTVGLDYKVKYLKTRIKIKIT